MTGGTSSANRPSYDSTCSNVVKGDSSRRKMVPMPQAVKELETHATHLFGYRPNTITLKHRGATPLKEDKHIANVRHKDVIVVEGDKGPVFEGCTTYRNAYPGHEVEPRKPLKQQPVMNPNIPFEGVSTYKNAFIGHEVSPRTVPKASPLKAPSVPFEGTSTYKNAYPGHEVKPRTQMTTPQPKSPSVPFDGTTTYKNAFIGHEVSPRNISIPTPRSPTVPFEGCSTYRNAFQGHEVKLRRTPTAPIQKVSTVPFDGSTTYKNAYIGHSVQPRSPVPRSTSFPGTNGRKHVFLEPAAKVR